MKSRYHRKYGYNYEVTSDHNRELMEILRRTCTQNGIKCDAEEIFQYLGEFPEHKGYEQLCLF